MNYKRISDFGSSITTKGNNPLTYCVLDTMNSGFNHGGIAETVSGKYGKNCQAFMASYCANNWDDVCEFASQNRQISYPNNQQRCGTSSGVACQGLTAGEVLVANTAARKYLSEMGGLCSLKYEPFDPTVASSPLISYWEGGCNTQGNNGCVPVYEVDPDKINDDPVMERILAKPKIALPILVNIYNTALRKNTLSKLEGTKLHGFFHSETFKTHMKMLSRSKNTI